jgi:hypothetical protein
MGHGAESLEGKRRDGEAKDRGEVSGKTEKWFSCFRHSVVFESVL